MKSVIKKLLVGKVSKDFTPKYNPIQKRILNIRAIWNNDHQDDNGIEKIVRLFLSFSQLLFPGVYIKYFANKIKFEYQDLAIHGRLCFSESYFSNFNSKKPLARKSTTNLDTDLCLV